MKKLVVANVVALIVVVAIMGLTLDAPSQAEDAPPPLPVSVEPGTVVSAVNASGTVEARDESSLAFRVDGYIQDVFVKEGQRVDEGTLLARLDTGDLELAVKTARIDLRKAEASLAQLKAAASGDEISSAKAALAKAQASYDALLKPDTTDEVTVAAADMRTAEVAVQQAQGAYDRVSWKGGVAASAEAQTLEEATIAYEKAKSNYNIANGGATDAELISAQADIASAKATLNDLLRGASAEEIAVNEADVEQAMVSVETAQRNLSQAMLVAPFAGTVTSLLVDAGQRATDATTVLTLADLSEMRVNVPVDEIDLPRVRMGQPVTITLDALNNRPLAGQVVDMAPAPTDSTDGTTTYEVRVALSDPDPLVRIGMNSKVAIETERREGVPMIPAGVIQTNDAGQTYVDRIGPDGAVVQTPVMLGQRSGQLIEVVQGLELGDQVLAPTTAKRPQAATTVQNRQGGGFMMMGGPPPGGGGFRPGGNTGNRSAGGR